MPSKFLRYLRFRLSHTGLGKASNTDVPDRLSDTDRFSQTVLPEVHCYVLTSPDDTNTIENSAVELQCNR